MDPPPLPVGRGVRPRPLPTAYEALLRPPVERFSRYKVVLLGDFGVGKTSVVSRFMYDTYDSSHQATIGIDFLAKTVFLKSGQTVRLQVCACVHAAQPVRCLI